MVVFFYFTRNAEKPNLLGKTLFSGESVDGIIRFAHSAESAADSEGGVRLQHNAGDGIDIAEVDLDGRLVLKRRIIVYYSRNTVPWRR